MSRLDIRHGDLHITHGGSGLLGPAVLISAAAGLAVVIAQFIWWIIAAAVIAAAAWFANARRIAANKARIAAAGAREREIQKAEAAARLAEQRRHELAVAAAGATVIQNIIDPAAILAAALHQSRPQPAPVAVRGEVER